jgi:serine protease Do
MKKWIWIVIAGLLIWNGILTAQLSTFQKQLAEKTTETKIINKVVTDFTTNVTKVVETSLGKVVGVSALYNGKVVSTGSGAIYDVIGKKVYVITNNHVIQDATSLTVKFANGKQVDAKALGTDLYTDLALLEATVDFTVTPFSLGDSSLVKVGENVLAIGSPLGFEFQGSVTMGIISGTDRVVPVDLNGDGIADWDSIVLQTDAAINPGNSGGPLINMAGELIGITSMKIMDQSVEGMGFAIPINEIIPIIEQLRANGKVIRPVLGISAVGIDEMTNAQKSFYGIQLDLKKGLYITMVTPSGPAAKAGIKTGDIVTIFDGTEITSFKQFRKLLYSKNVGDKVVIKYTRDGKETEISVTLQ